MSVPRNKNLLGHFENIATTPLIQIFETNITYVGTLGYGVCIKGKKCFKMHNLAVKVTISPYEQYLNKSRIIKKRKIKQIAKSKHRTTVRY